MFRVGGRRGLDLELKPDDLISATQADGSDTGVTPAGSRAKAA